MAAGGAFVPVEPGWPQARRRRVLANARAQFVLIGSGAPDGPEGTSDLAIAAPRLVGARAPSLPSVRP